MAAFTSKVCIVGEFAVGKTSTAERYVNNQFSDKYMTTIGVKVDTKEMQIGGVDLKLVIWDIAGTEKFSSIDHAYLRGASGYLLVADGTRSGTVATAISLSEQLIERFGELPSVFLVNKSDLTHSWEVSKEQLESLSASDKEVFLTSAKSGDGVEAAFRRLGALIIEREIHQAG